MLLEIRVYTIVDGRRDEFSKLFDERLAPAHRAMGLDIVGQFESTDDPNVFIWIRRFQSLDERERQWAIFYGSDVWKNELKPIMNPMIADSSRVYLGEPTPESKMQ